MLHENKLLKTLKEGGVVIGTMILEARDRGVIFTLARGGMDYIFIDLEHTVFTLETVDQMVNNAHAAGVTPVVRIQDLSYENVTRVLDLGCQNLILPHIRTGEEARRFIDYAHYHPEGSRGVAIYHGVNTNYEHVGAANAMKHANENILLSVVIETREAIDNLEDILIPGIDMVLVGHQDLSASLGHPGQYTNPSVRGAGDKVRKLCRERGIALAEGVRKPEHIKSLVEEGAQFLIWGSELTFIRRQAEEGSQALEQALAEVRKSGSA